jgi:hypothetical protein
VDAQTYLGARARTGWPGHMMIDGGYPRECWWARPLVLYGTSSGEAGDSYESELTGRRHQFGGAGGRACWSCRLERLLTEFSQNVVSLAGQFACH